MLKKAGGGDTNFAGCTNFGQVRDKLIHGVRVRLSASALCLTISLIWMNILKLCVLQGLMEPMQHLLSCGPWVGRLTGV